jgi:hypothetical protein
MRPTTKDSVGASQSRHLVITVACASLLGVIATAGAASAQSSDTTTAEALFRQGKQALDAKDYAKGCPMLAESYRLDPATGAMLALATCHEQQGKLASAWSEFAESASRSQREGRADRVAVARERLQALEPRLSTLTITVSDAIVALAGFELRRDGVVLGKAVLGAPVPVDGGDHSVEVVATSKKVWRGTVTVGREKDKKTVNVSSLEGAAAAPPAAKLAPKDTGAARPQPEKSSPATPPTEPSGGMTNMQVGGLAVGGAGVVGIVIGSAFGLSAISKNNDAKTHCSNGVCDTPDAQKSREDARAAGNVSTIAFVAGGVLAATGVTLFFVGKRKQTETPNVSIAPVAAPTSCGISLQGAF